MGETIENLKENILKYVDDSSHNYAIAVEGRWGTGKTYFFEKTIRPALKIMNKKLVRISLFGVASVHELYERMAAALLIEDKGGSKSRTFAREIGRQAWGATSQFTKKYGFSLSAGLEIIVQLLTNDKQILVFDDVERRSTNSQEDLSLFGTINNLIENLGMKVIFVMNPDALPEQQSIKLFEKEIKEKLVWKVYKFAPSPELILDNILGETINDSNHSEESFSIHEALYIAAEKANCDNARAVIRAESLLRSLVSLQSVKNTDIPVDCRKFAFIDIAQIALLCCMGNPPSASTQADKHEILESLDASTRQELFDKYSDLHSLQKYFGAVNLQDSQELESDYEKLIARWYPDSIDTAALKKITDQLSTSAILDKEDSDIIESLRQLNDILERGEFSMAQLASIVVVSRQLRRIGFEEALDDTRLREACKNAISKNIYSAYTEFSQRSYRWENFYEEDDIFLKELCQYTNSSFRKRPEENSTLPDSERLSSGSVLVKELQSLLENNPRQILQVEAASVATCFTNSDAQGQECVRSFFINELGGSLNMDESTFVLRPLFADWFGKIRSELSKQRPKSRMGKMRQKYFLENLSTLSKNNKIGYSASDTCTES